MQNPIQNETTTTQRATQRATLAELLAARADEIAEQAREQAQREQRAREQERADCLASTDDFLRCHIGAQLADILRITPAVDDNALRLEADEPDENHPRPGYLLLDLSGAGVDNGVDDGVDDGKAQHDAASDSDRADRPPEGWTLRDEYVRYHGWGWTLRGPHDFAARMPPLYRSDATIDTGLLDAIAAYPAWLASADQRAEEQRRKQAEREREQERERLAKQIRHYTSIEGYTSDPGVLWPGRRLLVMARHPRGADGIIERRGWLETYSDQWLLLNLDGHTRGALGAQRLIPIASVIEIQPLPDLAPSDIDPSDAA